MTSAVDARLVAVATELGPRIAEYGAAGEREGRLPQPLIDLLAGVGLFRLLLPASLGGLEVSPLTCARVIEEVAGFDSAAGWVLQAANSGDWYCARLPDEGVEEIYAQKTDTVISLSINPPMAATAVEGGYRLSGQSPLASNIHDADWLMVLGAIPDGTLRAMFVSAAHVTIVDTWDSLGMRGTDSNDVVLDDAFVPASRTWAVAPTFRPGRHYQGPLYRFPGIGEGAFILPPVPLAIARSAVSEVRRLAERKTPFGSATLLADRPVAQATLGRAEALLRAARAFLYETLSEAWERTVRGEASTQEQKAEILLASTHAVRSSVEAVDLVYGLAGTSAIYTRSPLERYFRDVQTLRHHGFIAERRYETYGQVIFGKEPDFPLATFGPIADEANT